jgi:CelD/BcsL family acetyltransferase involved in cellulose biosynthesis
MFRHGVETAMIEHIGDADRFRALRSDWDELLRASSSDSPFLTWEWLFSWWSHFSEDRKLHILALRENDRLIAIAPLASRARRVAGMFPGHVLGFLGTGSVGSDYLDLIVRRGREGDAFTAFADHFANDDIVLEMAQLDLNASVARSFAATLGGQGWNASVTKTHVCPFIDLSGHTWSSYLATLGSEYRKSIQRSLMTATKRFDVQFVQARSQDERREALACLVSLHLKRWQARGGSTAFYTPALVAFHEEFSQRALERGWLRLFVLRLDGTPVSAFYGFRYGRRFYYYQSGFEPEYGKYSVGHVLMASAIKSAIEEGAEEYDFLHGDEPYKFRWARGVRELHRLELYPPCLRGWLCRGAVETGRAARRLARRVLPQTAVRALEGGRRHGIATPPHDAASR